MNSDDADLIQEFSYGGSGFAPLFISDDWQVAQLNFDPTQALGNIKTIDIHFKTDELFVLLEGRAVLIAAEREGNCPMKFLLKLLEPNIVYNIPRMTWHNMCMEEGAKVLIFEDENSHLGEYEIANLKPSEVEQLNAQISVLLRTSAP